MPPSATNSRPRHFVLIDGHALIYRAYHAFTDLSTSQGVLVNAVYGFSRILLTVMREIKPEYIAVAFDHQQPTFRHTEYIDYKANRAEMPDDLKPQIDIIKRVVTAFNIPQFILPGYEADDLIGTLACQITEQNVPDLLTMIVTGDRDAFQLVNDKVHVWMPGRGKQARNGFKKKPGSTTGSQSGDTEYDAEGVFAKMGVTPAQIIDLKALMGDASDNIPGITGVGEKTAVRLLQEFGSVENLYATITGGEKSATKTKAEKSVLTPKLLQKLIDGYQDALMSKQLATIDCHSPVTLDLEACRLTSYKKEDVLKIFEELEFESLIGMLPADQFELSVQEALF